MKFITLFLIFCSYSLFAENFAPQTDLYVNLDISYTRVYLKPQGTSHLKGNMVGMEGNFEYMPLRCFYGALGGSWRYGSPHGMDDSKRNLFDGEIYQRLGYTFTFFQNQFLLTPYSGFGYRHLMHKIRTTPAVRFYYNYFYIPLGLQGRYYFPYVTLGFFVVWMPQIFPTLTVDAMKDARWITDVRYKNVRLGLPIALRLESVKNLSVFLKPSFELWQDGQSRASTSSSTPTPLPLPQNTYVFWEVALGVEYTF
ncbi:hypothetical protein [Simkania sp.]|uniref:hypothetical protein n=1 Tax=Simkania sp. TaxID=34094 RepID=UPI003B521730